MPGFIAIYGIAAVVLAVLAGFLAASKNRNISAWIAWTVILPPAIVFLVLMPTHRGERRRPLTLDEEDILLGD